MEEIRIKDVIFSFRHLYLENLKRLNKRLKKHIKIGNLLIDDITLYFNSSLRNQNRVNIKYNFRNGSLGSIINGLCESLCINSRLNEYAEIKQGSDGEYHSNTKSIKLKDQRITKDIDCALKEDFYQNIVSSCNSNDIRVSFSEYDITFSCSDFLICYNAVGDVLYTYSYNPIEIEDILNRPLNVDTLPDYHRGIIREEKKHIDTPTPEIGDIKPGDYTIKECDKSISLKKLKKNQLSRYI